MPITKFDLYNAEWLDLVFDHRNKEYGAYELRRHYGQTMSKAMGLTFAGLAVIVVSAFIFRGKPVEILKVTPVDLTAIQIRPPVAPPKKAEPPKSTEPPKPVEPVKTVASPPPVVVPVDPIVQPHTTAELQASTIGATDSKGADKPGNAMDMNTNTGTSGAGPVVDNTIHDMTGGDLEAMPEPVGGAAAWSKFLQKNLRFPAVAQEQGV